MEFVGHNGQIHVYDDRIVISRKGFCALVTSGFKGDKTIPISSISAVQFKKASIWVNGYIQFTIQGGVENRGGAWDAVNDENSVMFRTGKQAICFAELKKLVEDLLFAVDQHKTVLSSNADELKKFSELRDCGVITDSEFQAKKKIILGI